MLGARPAGERHGRGRRRQHGLPPPDGGAGKRGPRRCGDVRGDARRDSSTSRASGRGKGKPKPIQVWVAIGPTPRGRRARSRGVRRRPRPGARHAARHLGRSSTERAPPRRPSSARPGSARRGSHGVRQLRRGLGGRSSTAARCRTARAAPTARFACRSSSSRDLRERPVGRRRSQSSGTRRRRRSAADVEKVARHLGDLLGLDPRGLSTTARSCSSRSAVHRVRRRATSHDARVRGHPLGRPQPPRPARAARARLRDLPILILDARPARAARRERRPGAAGLPAYSALPLEPLSPEDPGARRAPAGEPPGRDMTRLRRWPRETRCSSRSSPRRCRARPAPARCRRTIRGIVAAVSTRSRPRSGSLVLDASVVGTDLLARRARARSTASGDGSRRCSARSRRRDLIAARPSRSRARSSTRFKHVLIRDVAYDSSRVRRARSGMSTSPVPRGVDREVGEAVPRWPTTGERQATPSARSVTWSSPPSRPGAGGRRNRRFYREALALVPDDGRRASARLGAPRVALARAVHFLDARCGCKNELAGKSAGVTSPAIS